MSLLATAKETIATLRHADAIGPVGNNDHLSPQVYFSWDAETADVSVLASTSPGSLLEAKLEISGTPRWLTLNIALGQGVFDVGDQIVLLADMAGDAKSEVTFSILSAQGSSPEDTMLDRPATLMPKGRVHTLIHSVTDEDVMAGQDAYHTLVLRLPKSSHWLVLNGLELRVLPRTRGVRAAPRRLADFA